MMNKRTLLTLAIFVIGISAACEMETEEIVQEEVRTVNVETELVQPEIFESYLRQVGTVTTKRDVQVASEVNGRIVNVNKQEGEVVRTGETVVQVDDRQLQQERNRLQANTEQSRENYERLKRLYEEENIGSEIAYLNAKYTYEQNKAALESVKIDIENASISAPFSGVIENVFTEVGVMVSPSTAVFRIISQDQKKIRLGVPARYSGSVDLADNAEVWFDYDTNTRYKLPVTFIGNSIDPTNRTFTVEIELPRDLDHVKIDMIANVRLRTEQRENAIVVGEQYVFQKGGNNVVYVVEENTDGYATAKEKIVSLGSTYGNNVVIEDGLDLGEELITIGASYLQDGTRIEKIVQQQSNEMAVSTESESN